MSFNMSLLGHMRAVRQCLGKYGARAEFRFSNFQLEVRANGRYYELLPQYAVYQNGRLEYTPVLSPEVTNFIGWRHYFNRQWELSNDKLAFKEYCKSNVLRTPQLFMNAADVTSDVIRKRARSSFGEDILGPFRPSQLSANQPLPEGAYYEEFIRGDIAKIWYWDDRVVALEVMPMVSVAGDGKSSVRALVAAIASRVVKVDWRVVEALARYQGLSSLDDVVPAEQRLLVDFRYLSGLHPGRLTKLNVLDAYRGTPPLAQMEDAGPFFWQGIPEDIRRHTLYSIDAIIDPNQKVAFLEMNSNPVVHPDTYEAMFAGLFGLSPIQTPVPNRLQPGPGQFPPQAGLPLESPAAPPQGPAYGLVQGP